ncbi:hypothetical protein MSG28_009754 [Choristoneura fumiferana]|uniref:Uncharacterized protein n=1 Tax=Choristoneura fumiferana TaxID=7141 RepID=A0ACC0JCH7_CHOFU|nr:hypothetical protein MSG28_009754 [Choristoneura fumiferana]
MSGCDSQKAEASKDNISTNSIDEGLPRELSQLSLSSASSQDEFYCDKGHSETALKNIYGYYQAQKLCDVVLIAGGTRIPAHKIVLSSCSEYFAAMFTGSLREAQLAEITLERVDAQALLALVHYCYTGTIELREETVEVLLSTASLLQLTTVVKHQEFLSLQVDQLASLLKSDDLNVVTEENVFESLMTWVQHDCPKREQHLPTLLKLIKLPLLSSEPLIMEAVKWHLLPERRSLLFSHRTRPRTSTIGRLLAIGGMDGYKGASNMEMYDPRTNSWTSFMRMGAKRLQFGVAVMQNKLVVVGGRDGLKTLNTVECFDLTSLTWSTIAPLNTHRHGLGVAVLGDGPNAPIYAVGGHDGWIYLNSVERWDACSRTWTMVAPMAGARSTCGVAALRGRLYAAGGRDGGACLRSVECYDPATNHWTNCAPMTRRRGGVSQTRGYDGVQYLCVVEVYDSESNCWRKLAPLTTGRAGAAVVAVPPPRAMF